jgi:hypothetical protein
MEKIKEYKFLILVLVVIAVAFFLGNKINYKNELGKQDLVLKCQEIYDVKHVDLENTRYRGQKADSVIWSPKTKTCLAYYNTRTLEQIAGSDSTFLFEVWDYTNSDLVLSYDSHPAKNCESIFIYSSLIYKVNKNLEASGCYIELSRQNIDVLTNFEKAMLDLGFKK